MSKQSRITNKKAEVRKKRHVCKTCDREHVDTIPLYYVKCGHLKYMDSNGNIYVDSFSVMMMLKGMGLDKHALEFMARIAEIRKKQ